MIARVILAIYAPQRSEYRQPLTAVLSILGITFFLVASRLLATVGAVRRLGSYLAARTLPIYIFHPLLLALLIFGHEMEAEKNANELLEAAHGSAASDGAQLGIRGEITHHGDDGFTCHDVSFLLIFHPA